MWFKSNGIIRYDPVRNINSIDRNGRTNRDKWWVVLNTDPEICRYYRFWVQKMVFNPLGFEKRKDAIKHGFHFIDQPSHGAHVSVVRGEEPDADHIHLWKKYDGKRVEYEYHHGVRRTSRDLGDDHDSYWFVDVRCKFLEDLRIELGRPVKWKFHMTIGRTWNE